jgi:hypothetical protein
MFEKASRIKLRFDTNKGVISVEDLWDLPLSNRGLCLDRIAKDLHLRLKNDDVVSFVHKTVNAGKSLDQLRFEIVKHIIDVRLTERDAAKAAADRSARKQRLLEIIADKEDDQLRDSSLDDLKKMAEEL